MRESLPDWRNFIDDQHTLKSADNQSSLTEMISQLPTNFTISSIKSNNINNQLIPLYCILLSLIIVIMGIYVIYKFVSQRSGNLLSKKLKFPNFSYDLEGAKNHMKIQPSLNRENEQLLDLPSVQLENLLSILPPQVLMLLLNKINHNNNQQDPKSVIQHWLNQPGNSVLLLLQLIQTLCFENNIDSTFISDLIQQECDRNNYV